VKHCKREDTRRKEEAQKRAGVRKETRKNQLIRETREKASLVFSFTHWSNIHRPDSSERETWPSTRHLLGDRE
jgi:hypothetical protein